MSDDRPPDGAAGPPRADGGGEDGGPTGDAAKADGDGDATGATDLRRRLVEQFSDGDRADVWRGLDRLLPTGAFLNLGYSPRYVPHVVGSSQRRLAVRLADGIAERQGGPPRRRGVGPAAPAGRTGQGAPPTDRGRADARLLDLGCGRGGPAAAFAERGYEVTGLDLVRYNVARARENAPGAFLVGDATRLPFAADAFGACAAVDSLVYVPAKARAFREVARVLAPGGVLATADLLAREDALPGAREPLEAFAAAWDMAPPVAADAYRGALAEAGLAVEAVEDVTANSTGRFRKWSRLFLALAEGPAGPLVERLLRRWGADPAAVVRRVRRAHEALPHLRHVIVYARVRE